MATQITRQQQRRDTTARWVAANPVLLAGEFGYDTTLNRMKVGDGVSQWTALSFDDEAGGAEEAQAAAEAAAAAAAESAEAAQAAAEETGINALGSVVYAPVRADSYQVVADDVTVYSFAPSGSTGFVTTARGTRLTVTVTCTVEAGQGGFIGAALRTAPGPLPGDAGKFAYVKTPVGEPTTVTVVVSLPVTAGDDVEVIPVVAGPLGEVFVNVGSPRPVTEPGYDAPLVGYGPASLIVQQT